VPITQYRSNSRSGALWFAVAALATLIIPFATGNPAPPDAAASSAPAPMPGNITPVLTETARTQPARRVRVIVQMRAGHTPAEGIRLARAMGGEPGRVATIINGFGVRMTAAKAIALAASPAVHAVSLDGAIKSRAIDGKRLKTAYNNSVGATRMWNRRTKDTTGRGIGVALVDTGVAGKLPDFRVSRRNGLSRIAASVVVNPNANTPEDTYGHGTHVAGIIAGDGRNRAANDPLRGDYVGVAPGAHIVSIKASDDEGRASVLDVIFGIQFAVDHRKEYGLRVLNLSLSSTVADSYRNDPLNAAAEAAWLNGLVVVAAAGNDGADADAVSYAPGNDPYVISVGAVDDEGTYPIADDQLAPWSSRGRTKDGFVKPDVLAPGARIVSTLAPLSNFTRLCADCVIDDEYFRAGGTSMAAGVVSGGVALLLESNPEWTPDQVKDAILRTARDVPGVGKELAVDLADDLPPGLLNKKQTWPTHPIIDPATGQIDYKAASWRAASWRGLISDDPLYAEFAGASWRCDCSMQESGSIDPKAASWRAASWRTSFKK
jgi:serine protease AprX